MVPGTSTMSLICIMKKSLWGTGKKFIMDSGSCEFRGFIDLFERGLYGIALVNNNIYWPTGIYGDGIITHFCSPPKVEHVCLSGDCKDIKFGVFVAKEENYNMIMMLI